MHQPFDKRPGYRVTYLVPVQRYIRTSSPKRAGECADHVRRTLRSEVEGMPLPILHSVEAVDDIPENANELV